MNKDKGPLIIAAIPAYNEEKTIAKVVVQASRYVDRVVVCDDGSVDMTAEIAEGLGADVVRHERNMGYGAAVQSMFRKARELDADIMVTLDGDGQHNPHEIPALVKPILEGEADLVVGTRFSGEANVKEVPFYRRMGIKAITKLTNTALNYGVRDAQNGFRAYGRKAIKELRLFEGGMGASVEILMEAKKKGFGVMETPVSCKYRGLERTSKHDPLRHGVGVLMSIVRLVVEDRPLLFLGVPGTVSLLVGVLFGIWMLQLYSIEHRIVTNIVLASMAFVLIGFFAVSTAITLYAIIRLAQKTK